MKTFIITFISLIILGCLLAFSGYIINRCIEKDYNRNRVDTAIIINKPSLFVIDKQQCYYVYNNDTLFSYKGNALYLRINYDYFNK